VTVPITTIAEIGQNFNGDLVLAKELIWAASESGANVAKFQLFNAAQLFSKHNNPWYEYNLSNELTLDQVYELSVECDLAKIEFMATPFDNVRVSWLEEIGVSRYKLASRSIQDYRKADYSLTRNVATQIFSGMAYPEWRNLLPPLYFQIPYEPR
jgi:sialic acid synthase SpsE